MPVDRQGRFVRLNLSGGRGVIDQLSRTENSPRSTGEFADSTVMQSVADASNPPINNGWYLLAFVIILALLKFASEHSRSGMEPKLVGINVWNMVAIGLMSILTIAVLKIIFNKWKVKGLTQIINMG